jgi:hypothetical protein
MDEAWRHAALEGALSESQMQCIDECMREVVLQMQAQMLHRQTCDTSQKNHQIVYPLESFQQSSGVETTDCDRYESIDHCGQSDAMHAFAGDVLFQAMNFGPSNKNVDTDNRIGG